jgi:HlyD family secretion protein
MNKIKFTAVTVAIAMVGGTAWLYRRADGKEAPSYKTAPIVRTSLKSTVTATGALQAVRTVQVGTQVSGQVSQLYVDFNDKVKKGQLLARIDPILQQQAVEDAQAQLEKAQAQLTQAQDEYNRNKQLFDAKVITASEFGTYQSSFSVDQASVKSAQIALDRAKQQLAYTNVYSPIDGVVVSRDVNVGQTVAASLSAPELFLLANDMSTMQILASVDESDIGQIKNGQSVTFTVQSYPNQTFTGTVEQVRLQSTTADNVVNYTAVISVKNPQGKLLPGMTATVEFLTSSASNVLAVPNAALRLRPTPEMLAAVGLTSTGRPVGDSTHAGAPATAADSAARRARFAAAGGGQRGGQGAAGGARGNAWGGASRSTAALVWYVDSAGTLHAARVHTGLSDGQNTQIDGKGLSEGMQVITSVAAAAGAPAAAPAASSPFPQQRRGRGF